MNEAALAHCGGDWSGVGALAPSHASSCVVSASILLALAVGPDLLREGLLFDFLFVLPTLASVSDCVSSETDPDDADSHPSSVSSLRFSAKGIRICVRRATEEKDL